MGITHSTGKLSRVLVHPRPLHLPSHGRFGFVEDQHSSCQIQGISSIGIYNIVLSANSPGRSLKGIKGGNHILL
jgi:hypothetical protein